MFNFEHTIILEVEESLLLLEPPNELEHERMERLKYPDDFDNLW